MYNLRVSNNIENTIKAHSDQDEYVAKCIQNKYKSYDTLDGQIKFLNTVQLAFSEIRKDEQACDNNVNISHNNIYECDNTNNKINEIDNELLPKIIHDEDFKRIVQHHPEYVKTLIDDMQVELLKYNVPTKSTDDIKSEIDTIINSLGNNMDLTSINEVMRQISSYFLLLHTPAEQAHILMYLTDKICKYPVFNEYSDANCRSVANLGSIINKIVIFILDSDFDHDISKHALNTLIAKLFSIYSNNYNMQLYVDTAYSDFLEPLLLKNIKSDLINDAIVIFINLLTNKIAEQSIVTVHGRYIISCIELFKKNPFIKHKSINNDTKFQLLLVSTRLLANIGVNSNEILYKLNKLDINSDQKAQLILSTELNIISCFDLYLNIIIDLLHSGVSEGNKSMLCKTLIFNDESYTSFSAAYYTEKKIECLELIFTLGSSEIRFNYLTSIILSTISQGFAGLILPSQMHINILLEYIKILPTEQHEILTRIVNEGMMQFVPGYRFITDSFIQQMNSTMVLLQPAILLSPPRGMKFKLSVYNSISGEYNSLVSQLDAVQCNILDNFIVRATLSSKVSLNTIKNIITVLGKMRRDPSIIPYFLSLMEEYS